jgi:hypothetical protein
MFGGAEDTMSEADMSEGVTSEGVMSAADLFEV